MRENRAAFFLSEGMVEKALKAIEDLYQIADLIEEEQKGTHYPYYLYARLQPLRIRLFADSAAKQLREKAE